MASWNAGLASTLPSETTVTPSVTVKGASRAGLAAARRSLRGLRAGPTSGTGTYGSSLGSPRLPQGLAGMCNRAGSNEIGRALLPPRERGRSASFRST